VRTLQAVNALKDGHPLRGGARFLFIALCVLLLSPRSAVAIELAELSRLAKGGASQLALALIAEHQPSFDQGADKWQRWERVRLRIMQEHGRWSELADHIATYPTEVPDEFSDWAAQHRANALINASRYVEARQLLRDLIWQTSDEGAVEVARLAQLRRLVMESYLEEGNIDDAYAAMLRYQQDYSEQSHEALLLRARVLLAADRAAESLALLKRMKPQGIVDALLALATIRSGGDAAKVLKQARSIVVEEEDEQQRWLWLGVMAEAAEKIDSNANLVIAMERMLQLGSSIRIPLSERRLFSLSPDLLWQGYLGYAERIANREQILLGDDAAWLKEAERTETLYPVRKRSLYVMLAINGTSQSMRDRAHQAIMAQFDAMGEEGQVLLHGLYLDSERYAERWRLPQVIAYRLVDEAIKGGDLPLASSLLQHLPEPPGDTERFSWQMRRAKVFLLAGDYEETDKLLSALMPSAAALGDQQRDQVVQLLFDLQKVNEHERAFRLLSQMYQSVPAIKLKRELLFWMADSRKAQAMHTDAARYYLQSATLDDNNSMDPWAQTARYQAAKSLTEAGLNRDAAYIYRELLKITKSPERRSVLRHELQQLRLQGERG